MRIFGAGASEAGRRTTNEDALGAVPDLGVYVVADGMGGYEGGEVASRLVVDTVTEFYARTPSARHGASADHARAALERAHREVLSRKRGALHQMGSTVALVAVRGARAIVAHAGDSRVYRLRHGRLERLTRDHSFVEEVLARQEDAVAPEDRARIAEQFGHVITRAVGIEGKLSPEVRVLDVEPRDVYLLSTDGLHGVLGEEEIAETLSLFDPATAAEMLVARALDEGSSDNVTALVIRAAL